jgi:hypothetical protein
VTHRCLAMDELESVRTLSPADPRRREIEACPRCRQSLLAYVEFLEDRSAPPDVDRESAAAHLRQAFARALEEAADTAVATPPAPSLPAAEPLARVARRVDRAWGWPRFRAPMAWATAAVVVVVGLAFYSGERWRRPAGGEDVLRTAPDSAKHMAGRPSLFEPRPVSSGVELRWTSTQGADAYRVVFLGEDLSQLARLDAGPDTLAVLRPGSLPPGLFAGRTVAWQVEALQGGYAIGSSETSLVRIP